MESLPAFPEKVNENMETIQLQTGSHKAAKLVYICGNIEGIVN